MPMSMFWGLPVTVMTLPMLDDAAQREKIGHGVDAELYSDFQDDRRIEQADGIVHEQRREQA